MVTSQLDVKTSCNSVSGRSYIASSPETSNVAVFEVSEICAFFVYRHRYTLLVVIIVFWYYMKQYHTKKV